VILDAYRYRVVLSPDEDAVYQELMRMCLAGDEDDAFEAPEIRKTLQGWVVEFGSGCFLAHDNRFRFCDRNTRVAFATPAGALKHLASVLGGPA